MSLFDLFHNLGFLKVVPALRFLPKGEKVVVLGLISSKVPQLESKEAIKARLTEAAKYAPLEQLALSPQCGFSSTVHGNEVRSLGRGNLFTDLL